MSDIIYIVTEGAYEDQSIVAAYSDEQTAASLAAGLEWGHSFPLEIGAFSEQLRQGLRPYRASVCVSLDVVTISLWGVRSEALRKAPHVWGFEDDWDVTLWARDDEDAKEKARAAVAAHRASMEDL